MIAFDLDDVLVDCVPIIRFVIKRDYGYDINKIKEYSINIPEIQDITEYIRCMIKNFSYCMKPSKGAKEAIQRLAKEEKIIIITARDRNILDCTKKWIEDNLEITNFSIINKSTPEAKYTYIKGSGIQYFVEDRLKTANLVSEIETVKKVYLINQNWNIGRDTNPKVVRMDGIISVVNDYFNEKYKNLDKLVA